MAAGRAGGVDLDHDGAPVGCRAFEIRLFGKTSPPKRHAE